MKTTRTGSVPPYIGSDLTDRYAHACKPIDVCGLGEDLTARFWQWEWTPGPAPLIADAVVQELRTARTTMIDGPQGLATPGQSLRTCERLTGAAGKTPDTRPSSDRPYAKYLWSSLDLFSTLAGAGISVSPLDYSSGVFEIYPGDIWMRLAGRCLPRKRREAGRLARKLMLEVLGVRALPSLPTDDQNDAAVGAVLAAAAHGGVTGRGIQRVGQELWVDESQTLREGQMIVPVIEVGLRERLDRALAAVPVIVATKGRGRVSVEQKQRARELLAWLINQAHDGNGQICTYSWAYRHIFQTPYGKWSQAYAEHVARAASETGPAELRGLGAVRLDTFIVTKNTGRPSTGHWDVAEYDVEDWERVLGTASLLE